MFGGNGISLADIAAVTKGNNDEGFGGNGWWILVLLWALGGNNGWGNRENNGSSCGSSVGAEVQRGFDTSAIIQKLDGINSGLCSLGYDQLAQMNGINTNIYQTGTSIQSSINNLSSKVDNCCCENRQAISQVRYDMATDTCAITTAIKDAAQQIMQNDNNNYRSLHDEQVQMQMQTMRDLLAQKDAQINQLALASSQGMQTNDIIEGVIRRLQMCPVGTYNVCNPNAIQSQDGCGRFN